MLRIIKSIVILLIGISFQTKLTADPIQFSISYKNNKGETLKSTSPRGRFFLNQLLQKNSCLKNLVRQIKPIVYSNEMQKTAKKLKKYNDFSTLHFELFLLSTKNRREKNALCNFSIMNLIVHTEFKKITGSANVPITSENLNKEKILPIAQLSKRRAILMR